MNNQDAAPRADRELPWWASPAGLNLGFLIPILLLVTYAAHSDLGGLQIRGVWFFTDQYVLLAIALLLVTSVSCWIGAQISPRSRLHPIDASPAWDRGALLLGFTALAAYLYFFRSLLADPVLLFHTFTGAYRPNRQNLEITAGLTSFENVAPVFFSIYAYKVLSLRLRVRPIMHLLCIGLLALTALRVYAWSERLALIEAALPFGLAGATRLSNSRNRLVRGFSSGGPFFAIPLLVLYFGVAESVRSWTAAAYHGRTGFWEFAVGRIATYYITSLNNGAGLLQTFRWPTYSFEYTAAWLHKIPLMGQTFSAYLNANGKLGAGGYNYYLIKFGDPEFNNPSGNFSVICDMGLPLGLTYFAVVGIAGGILFRAYRAGTLPGVLLYPMFFLAFLEVFRYPYLGTQRAFTWAIGIGIALLLSRPPRQHALSTPQTAP